jgi:hypothetical protein
MDTQYFNGAKNDSRKIKTMNIRIKGGTTSKELEAISKIGFWFKISRRNSAGQKRGAEFQPAGILNYVEDLKREPSADIGPKGIFEIASS